MNFHPINDIFEFNHHFYKVIKCNVCEKCALHNCDCFSLMDIFGTCEANHRPDNSNVIFKDVTKKIKPLTMN